MLAKVLGYAKAVVGGLAAGPITLTDWLGVIAAVLGGAGLVAVVPNKTTPAPAAGSTVSSVPPAAS